MFCFCLSFFTIVLLLMLKLTLQCATSFEGDGGSYFYRAYSIWKKFQQRSQIRCIHSWLLFFILLCFVVYLVVCLTTLVSKLKVKPWFLLSKSQSLQQQRKFACQTQTRGVRRLSTESQKNCQRAAL